MEQPQPTARLPPSLQWLGHSGPEPMKIYTDIGAAALGEHFAAAPDSGSPVRVDLLGGKEAAPAEPASFSFSRAAAPVLEVHVPPLVRFAERGDERQTRRLLDAGSDPNSNDDFGLTALHCAAKKGHGDVVQLLLERRASCDAASRCGETPLHFASKYGNADVALALLRSRADPAAIANDGKDPLQHARARCHRVVEGILLGSLARTEAS
mmetsp:Transcript_32895/g.83935  ORF Transcript_32895/g.83935 Transcript_32895/m.83935 type:complete len:210 (-) Transcript_32895:467-1096(-)